MAPPGEDDEEVDRLYELPLSEFVAARNALAKSVRAGGDKEAAAAIAALRKPSVTAWALNQVARKHPEEIDVLVHAVEALRTASAGAVSGRGSAPMREARDSERDAIRRLVERARSVLESGGHAASEAQLLRIGDALRAAAGSEAGREALRAGRLAEEPVAEFDDLSTMLGSSLEAVPPPSAEEREADERAALEAEAVRLAAAAASAEKEAARLERKAEAAELQAEAARDEAIRARNDAEEAVARAEEAAARLKNR